MGKLKGISKGLKSFKDSVKDLPSSDFKYKSSRSKKTDTDSGSDNFFPKFLSRIDKDPALRERIKSEFKEGKKGLFTESALKEYNSGKGKLFKKLNPTAEELSQALSKKKPVKHSKGGIVKAAKKVAKKAFPDLSNDGKVTKKDILIAKGVLKKKTDATKKAKSEGNPMRDMVNESASAKAADKARRKSNKRIAAEAIGGAAAMGVAGTIAYKADKAAEAADKEKQTNKKPVKKANGGMLNSPAAVKRRSGAAVKGFKKGGMATKWESKWG